MKSRSVCGRAEQRQNKTPAVTPSINLTHMPASGNNMIILRERHRPSYNCSTDNNWTTAVQIRSVYNLGVNGMKRKKKLTFSTVASTRHRYCANCRRSQRELREHAITIWKRSAQCNYIIVAHSIYGVAFCPESVRTSAATGNRRRVRGENTASKKSARGHQKPLSKERQIRRRRDFFTRLCTCTVPFTGPETLERGRCCNGRRRWRSVPTAHGTGDRRRRSGRPPFAYYSIAEDTHMTCRVAHGSRAPLGISGVRTRPANSRFRGNVSGREERVKDTRLGRTAKGAKSAVRSGGNEIRVARDDSRGTRT